AARVRAWDEPPVRLLRDCSKAGPTPPVAATRRPSDVPPAGGGRGPLSACARAVLRRAWLRLTAARRLSVSARVSRGLLRRPQGVVRSSPRPKPRARRG